MTKQINSVIRDGAPLFAPEQLIFPMKEETVEKLIDKKSISKFNKILLFLLSTK